MDKISITSRTVLETQRLILRELTDKDFTDICAMLQDPRTMYAWETTFSDNEVRDWICRMRRRYREDGFAYWAAVEKESGDVIGQIGLLKEEIEGKLHTGVGYMLRREYWGRGYALEGASACLRHAFYGLGIRRVIADIRPENAPSVRVAQRLGMNPANVIVKHVHGKNMPHRIFLKRTPLISVEKYNPEWPERFNRLRELLSPAMTFFSCRLEHVGSTAVPGLSAKPVIDADLILNEPEKFDAVKLMLEHLGFGYRGDLGLPGRETFTESLQLDFPHNLYVCFPGATPLRNHLNLRDYLRRNPDAAMRYGALKHSLSAVFPDNADAYCASKTELITEFLAKTGLGEKEIASIRETNLSPIRSSGSGLSPAEPQS